jgi:hypothetical protein
LSGELRVRYRYRVSPLQHYWIKTNAREKLFGGAKRGGKSVALAMHISELCHRYPGNRGLLARKNMTDLLDSTLDEFQRTVPPELYEWKRGERKIVFRNGSECLYRGLGEEGEFEKAKSVTIGFLALDEPSEIPFAAFSQLNAQLTHTLPDGSRPPYMALLACNPEPGWVKDRYVTHPVPGSLYVQALPRDNPGLPAGWEDGLRHSMNADWVRRYLDGSWEVFEGQVFMELEDRLHNLDNWTGGWSPTDYKHWMEGLRKIGCIDHATTGITTYGQDGIDRDENMFSLDEYYRSNRLISEHAQSIRLMMAQYGANDYTLIDPSTAAKTQQGPYELYSYLDEYRRNGIVAMPARRSSIEVGLNLLKEKLHVDLRHRHPFTGELGSPRWFISRGRCANLWKELSELRQDLLPAGGLRYIGADHAIDTKRYVAMSRPNAPALPGADTGSLSTQERQVVRSHAAWQKKFDKTIPPKVAGTYW